LLSPLDPLFPPPRLPRSSLHFTTNRHDAFVREHHAPHWQWAARQKLRVAGELKRRVHGGRMRLFQALAHVFHTDPMEVGARQLMKHRADAGGKVFGLDDLAITLLTLIAAWSKPRS
jgi:hypothetical protein